MGLSVHSALAIYCNPYDLCLYIGESGGKYSVYVSFGPERNCRPIVTTEPVFANKEESVAYIGELLDISIRIGDRERTGGNGQEQTTGMLLGADEPHFDQTLRDRILADLRSDWHQANTYEYECAA